LSTVVKLTMSSVNSDIGALIASLIRPVMEESGYTSMTALSSGGTSSPRAVARSLKIISFVVYMSVMSGGAGGAI
jgi:hypothetical protein